MKTLTSLLLCIFLGICLLSCEEQNINQRAGTYIGTAEINCIIAIGTPQERLASLSMPDTITVKVVDVDDRRYQISRSSFNERLCVDRYLDIGDSKSEFSLDNQFMWSYTISDPAPDNTIYFSEIDLSDADTFKASMSVENSTDYSFVTDQGDRILVFADFEYKIKAQKQ